MGIHLPARTSRGLFTVLACLAVLVAPVPGRELARATATTTPCVTTTQPLGAATGWTEFVEGGGHRGSESEGSIAWGGNLDASGMTVGTRLTSAASAATLVVAGTHGQYFNLQRGSAWLVPASGVNFNGGGGYLASNPVDFAAAFTQLRAASATWASAPATGTAALGTAGGNTVLVLTGTDPTLNVFNLTPAQLVSGNGIGYDVPAGSTVLVNVSGTTATLQGQMWVKQGGGYQQANDTVMESWPGVLWNFPDATTVSMSFGSAWGGTILAPNAALTIASVGHTIGQVIAKTFSSNFETHQRLFPSTVCLPGTPPPTPRSDVRVTKTAAPTNPHGGDLVTYTLVAQNVGTATATGVVVRDQLPAGVTFDSASAPCAQAAGVVTCPVGDLAPGAARTLTITVVANPIAGAGAPSDPQAYHELTPYKTEMQVDLEAGQTRSVTVSCAPDDLLADGSIRVDHVDQGTGGLADVHVLSAESTGLGSWKAVVRNDATGRAQAKAFAVCLPARTEMADRHTGHPDGHRHPLSADAALVSATQAWGTGRQSRMLACPVGTMPIAPGFSFSGGAATLAGSEPATGGWTFTADVTSPTTSTLTLRCLRTTVGAEQGHTHDLRTVHVTRTVSVPALTTVEEQVVCPDDAKGIVATWLLPPGVHSLGNDPRLKARAFKLVNDTGSAQSAMVDLECLRDRTGVEVMGSPDPVVVDNTATVTSTSVDANPGNNSATASVTVRPGTSTAVVTRSARADATRIALRTVSSMSGRAALTVRDGHRVLARGAVALRAGGARHVHLLLTRAGRQVLAAGATSVRVRLDPSRGPATTSRVVVRRG